MVVTNRLFFLMDIIKHPLASIAAISDGKNSSTPFEKMGLEGDVKPIPLAQSDDSKDANDQVVADPKRLMSDRKSQLLLMAYDGFLMAIPLLLIVKVVLCIVAYNIDLWNRGYRIGTVSGLTIFLVNFNSQLSTAFTIAFITIMSTMARRWALYKAQRGAHLAELEQLQASISLPSTAKMIWSLRRFGALSGGLLFLWCFYYLGSQACQREYFLADSKPFHNVKLAMIAPEIVSDLSTETNGADSLDDTYNNMRQTLTTMYTFQTSRGDQTPYDASGNPRVPLIESLTGTSANRIDKFLGRGEWLDVGTVYGQDFAALSGPRIWQNYSWHEFDTFYDYGKSALDSTYQFLGHVNFTSRYIYISCSDPVQHEYSSFPNGTLASSNVAINFTRNDRGIKDGSPTIPRQFELWGRWNDTQRDDITVKIGSISAQCNLTASSVDVKADCLSLGCAAKKVRRSPGWPEPSPVTPFDAVEDVVADDFFNRMLLSMGPLTVKEDYGDVSITGVADAIYFDMLLKPIETPADFQDPENATRERFRDLTNRLSSVINTYYGASIGSPYTCKHNSVTGEPSSDCIDWTGKGAVYNPQYLLSIPWIVIDFVSCFILLAAAIFGYWLRRRTIAPDIFGYVSSLTRENPHFDLATETGSALSGLERARLLGNVKIKIGEYAQEDGLPRVIVSHVADGYEADPLNKEGKYV